MPRQTHAVRNVWARSRSGSGCASLWGCHTQSSHMGELETCLETQGWPDKATRIQPWLEGCPLWGEGAVEWTPVGGQWCCRLCLFASGCGMTAGSLYTRARGPPGERMMGGVERRRLAGGLEQPPGQRGTLEGTVRAGARSVGCMRYPMGMTDTQWSHLQKHKDPGSQMTFSFSSTSRNSYRICCTNLFLFLFSNNSSLIFCLLYLC